KGVEGGLIYAFSRPIRDEIDRSGLAAILLDLRPDLSLPDLSARLNKPRGRDSFSNYLRKTAGLSPVAIGLVHESGGSDLSGPQLALRIKSLPLCVTSPFPIADAISSAGGVPFAALDEYFMFSGNPGVFAAGEMLDWEAPTGGYLLQASFSTAIRAAQGILRYCGN
ncbi:MAG TPA: NAD(P)/FAD-dependent oxidoreductase, partial [Micavibrio sp.]